MPEAIAMTTEPQIARHLRDRALIAGEWVTADDGSTFDVSDPATGAVLAQVAAVGAAEARVAVAAALSALPAWRARAARDRAAVLRRWGDLLVEQADDLAALLTAEQGKPLAEARTEILSAASFLEWFGEEAKRVYGETIPSPDPAKRLIVLKQPIGVCAGITPWNFPASMVTRKAGPALAAGCTFVLKPAEQTPLTALALAALAIEAGVPAGVLNVLTVRASDAPAVGLELSTHPDVRKVSFTGSTEVGKLLMAQSAGGVKKVALELGGNAPFVIFEDADLDAAVTGVMFAKFRNAGQACIAANRILVADAIYEEVVERLVHAASALRVGAGAQPGTQIGPLIDGQAHEKARRHVSDAVARGGRVRCGGAEAGGPGPFFAPTVISDVPADALLAVEETFAPVAGLIRFTGEAEAIAMANATPYGLAAYVYTRDLARSWRVSEALDVGIVGINTPSVSDAVAPFGGVKESGVGREGSRHGLDDFLELKLVAVAVA